MKESEKVEGRSYVKYSGVSAIVSTKDDIYTLFIKFRYNKQDDEYTLLQLKVISGKSEAYENFDFYNEDNYNDEDVFLFVNKYDEAFDALEEYPTYQTIFGLVLASRGKSKALDIDEADDLVGKNLTKEGLVEEIGEPLAYVEKVLTYYYYINADDEDTFIMFKIGKDGNVESCKEVSDKYTGWLDLDFCGK